MPWENNLVLLGQACFRGRALTLNKKIGSWLAPKAWHQALTSLLHAFGRTPKQVSSVKQFLNWFRISQRHELAFRIPQTSSLIHSHCAVDHFRNLSGDIRSIF